ncbi:MAG: leucine-rich repeat domain-containing protein, partial [Bacteroidaceae bacterium]|nr:leucine-rich repeat domain-containing protein [Bacteroidaceae bacterium]
GLTNIKVESGNTIYDSRDNCNAIIETATNKLIRGCKNTIIPNSVTSIGDDAFYGCTGLTNITIPNSVTSIGDDAFSGCTGLTSIEIPNSVTTIEYSVFRDCTCLTSVTIPSSVTKIEDNAFDGCSGLTSIKVESGNTIYDSRDNCNAIIETATNKLVRGCKNTIIPNSVTSIGDDAFYGCTGLTNITIPNSVTKIGDNAFYGCTGLTSIEIPNSVTTIEYSAFRDCTCLTSVTIPNSLITIRVGAFYGCTALKSVYLLKEDQFNRTYSFVFPNTTSIYTPGFQDSQYNKILAVAYKSKKTDEISFTIKSNYDGLTIKKVIFGDIEELTPNEKGVYKVGSLTHSTKYKTSVVCEYAGNEYTLRGYLRSLTTTVPHYNCNECTQTTMTFNLHRNLVDIPEESGIYIPDINEEKFPANEKGIVKIENLSPDTEYTIQTYAVYDGETYYSTNSSIYKTKAVELDCSSETVSSTSLVFKGTHNLGDATFVSCGYEGYEGEGSTLTLTGLKPNTLYTVGYYVTTEEGGTVTKRYTAKTDAIAFNTLPARATSNTRAVICAEANIVNEETGTGFEWRRIDAPDLVPSNYAQCAVNDGVIEGVLSNLSANTYYKYRPYYCSADGTYYYGEWIGFGTADAYVYFTPTVHTYAATMTAANSVHLYGYALAGSDDIIEQGFEYWTKKAVVTRSMGEIKKVVADGQRMSVLIEDLEYGMVYECRAYVRTAKETIYGDTQTFTTNFATAVEEVAETAVNMHAANGILHISGLQADEIVHIFTLHGKAIYCGTDKEIPLANGIYIVKAGDITSKIIME